MRLPATVPADTPVVFAVTSRDVNHGFGIYDPRDRLVGQVQAMPDYVNRLPFSSIGAGVTPSAAWICGIGHAAMQGSFEVR